MSDAKKKLQAYRMRLRAQRTGSTRDLERTMPPKSARPSQIEQIVQSLMGIQLAHGAAQKKAQVLQFLNGLDAMDDDSLRALFSMVDVNHFRRMCQVALSGTKPALHARLMRLMDAQKPPPVAPPSGTKKKKKNRKHKKAPEDLLSDLEERPALAPAPECTLDGLLQDLDADRPALRASDSS